MWERFGKQVVRVGLVVAIAVGAVGCAVTAGTTEAVEGPGPEAVAEGFYDWYLDYNAQEGANAMVDGAYRDRSELTEGLVAEVDAMIANREMGGGDPFLCAQDIPGRLSVGEVDVAGDAATITMDALYAGNPMASHFDVVLERPAGTWQIADTVCTFEQTPLTAEQTVLAFYDLYLEASQHRNLLVTEAYRDMPFLAPEFVEKVDGIIAGFDRGGYDPFLCAQDVPTEVRVTEATVEGGEATVEVETSFEAHGFSVRLAERDGQWLITDVACR